ncbi:hypothetical protein WICPIJ_005356 [Wickerhamomyces pijperi]|uniref:SPIN90/Ldb17 leucine-rich domain-containing protein n=1 Tax=Wickerhamomyces pijperi TaxID=599730 RepID=A0A9P8Q3R6_WICPI|nr:hypothetical protein WICPIJ_005356 [Wickerhamomyces pijperi]
MSHQAPSSLQDEIVFQDPAEFWTYIQNSLICDTPQDPQVVNTKLVAYLKIVADHINIYVNDDQDLYRCGLSLVNSEIYENNKVFCLAKSLSILSISDELISTDFKYFISYVILLDCKNDASVLDILEDYHGFVIIATNVRSIFHNLALLSRDDLGESKGSTISCLKNSATVQLDILFQMCKFLSLKTEDLAVIDEFFVNYIFESLIVAYNEEDIFNSAKFKIILALNEQFMVLTRENKAFANVVFQSLKNHRHTARNFNECLLVYFNRESDRCLQIMISKLLYLIFTDAITSDLFYHNDLNVLVDVVLRELTDMSEDEETTRTTFLRILHIILNTKQITSTKYRKNELRALLLFLSGQCSSFWEVSDQTKRLALKCLAISWLAEETPPPEYASVVITSSSPTPESLTATEKIKEKLQYEVAPQTLNVLQKDINNSDTSLNSMSKKRPPPPVPRRSFGVSSSNLMGR